MFSPNVYARCTSMIFRANHEEAWSQNCQGSTHGDTLLRTFTVWFLMSFYKPFPPSTVRGPGTQHFNFFWTQKEHSTNRRQDFFIILMSLKLWLYWHLKENILQALFSLKAQARAFLPISQSGSKQRKNLSAYFINHWLAVLCKFFWVVFGHFGKEIFFLKGEVKLRKIWNVEDHDGFEKLKFEEKN